MSASFNLRRSDVDDVEQILALVGEAGEDACAERFPTLRIDLTGIIVQSYVSMTAINAETNKIIGFVALNEAPATVKADDFEDWLSWLAGKSGKMSKLSVTNTLWLNYAVTQPGYEASIMEQALRTAMTTLPEVDFAAYMLPAGVPTFQELDSTFEEVSTPDPPEPVGDEFDDAPARFTNRLFVCRRDVYIPTLNVRGALVEDYDDLIEVFESQSASLKEQYGEFFLAELIEAQNEDNQALVAEVDGRAVGLMNLTTEIQLEVLQNCFELGPYNNLMREAKQYPTSSEDAGEVKETELSPQSETAETPVNEGDAAPEAEAEAEGDAAPEAEAEAEGDAAPVAEAGAEGDAAPEAEAEAEGDAAPGAEVEAEGDAAPEAGAEGDAEAGGDAAPEADGDESKEQDATAEAEEALNAALEAAEDDVGVVEEEEAAPEKFGEPTPPADLVSSAFAATLFCVDESYESRAHDFLARAFATFPDREFCIVTLPHMASESALLARFTSVPPKPGSSFSHVLYVIHRDALLSPQIRVSRLNPELRQSLDPIVSVLEDSEKVGAALDMCIESSAPLSENPKMAAFVPTCGDVVLGLVVVSREQCDKASIEWMKTAYRLDDYLSSDQHDFAAQAHILHFAINPIFQRSTRFVIREIMRQYRKTCMYFRVYPNQIVPSMISEMVQAPPRSRPALRPGEIRGEAGSGNLITGTSMPHAEDTAEADGESSFALHFLSRKLLSEPKLVSNARVVVVGASDTGIAALQSLVLLPYLHFTRLTLLAVGGIPMPGDNAADPGAFLPNAAGGPCGFSKRHLEQLNLPTSVRIVDARMVAIDREGKAVLLDDDTIIPYDRLLLATGLIESSRQMVDEIEQQQQQQNVADDVVTALDHPAVHFLEGPQAASSLEESVNTVIWQDESLRVAVYGRSLDAYTAVQGLLARNVSAGRIVRIVPPDASAQSRVEEDGAQSKSHPDSLIFGKDNYVASTIESYLADAGASRIDGTLSELIYMEEGRLSGARIAVADGTGMAEVAFDVLIFADSKDVDRDIFVAANESGLVYDGRLVVDGRFCTADSAIFAAGTLTKFSRRYGRTRPRHESFNSVELGVAVSQSLMEDLDPLAVPTPRNQETGRPIPPNFFKPKGKSAMLPGGLFFTHVECCASPGRRSDEPPFVSARELITNPKDPLSKVGGGRGLGMRYCRIVLDEHRRIASITYLGNEPMEDVNFGVVVGMQESYLNSLEHFFDKGAVPDLCKHLRGDWAVAVYHDRFRELCMNLSVSTGSVEEIQGILTSIRDAVNNGSSLEDIAGLRKESIGVGGSKLLYDTRRTIELQMLKFLRENRTLLPMFFLPEE